MYKCTQRKKSQFYTRKGVNSVSSLFITSRDDDDINDVASMAGVNLSEESARILATNSELVGAVTRSCKDETFLSTSLLTRRALEIGETRKRHVVAFKGRHSSVKNLDPHSSCCDR